MLAQSVLVVQQLPKVAIQLLLDMPLLLVVALQVTVMLTVLLVVLVVVLEKQTLVPKLVVLELQVKVTLAVTHQVVMDLQAVEVVLERLAETLVVAQLEFRATVEQVLVLILVGV
jgi:hypothetical protein